MATMKQLEKVVKGLPIRIFVNNIEIEYESSTMTTAGAHVGVIGWDEFDTRGEVIQRIIDEIREMQPCSGECGSADCGKFMIQDTPKIAGE